MVFIVYNCIGIKKHGAWGYIKSFIPSGDAVVAARG